MPLSSAEIREEFLRFFEERGHRRVPSASLVPDSDPTLMFVNAGMVPFKRVFLGDEARGYSRACSSQKCMRVSGKHNDLEEVGRSKRHHTFFEMLGNFSFGDYFKEQALEYAWELLTERYGIAPESMAVSVFREDDEAYAIWRDRIGVPEEKIFRLDEEENFWSMGETGPCGPCSEIHMDYGPQPGCQAAICDPSCECGRWLEIWNNVFMQFDRDASGKQTPLPKPSIDTGMGLDRITQVLQGVESNYDTDAFQKIIGRISEISGVEYGADAEQTVSLKIVADHARALTFLIGDGVLPSNEGRGYVLRRILRRASRQGVLLGVEDPFVHRVADAVIDEMAGAYPELSERRAFITERIRRDEERFLETLSKGLTLLEGEIGEARARGEKVLSGDAVFKLYDTFGFPVDLTELLCAERGLKVDMQKFEKLMEQQRTRARAAQKSSVVRALDISTEAVTAFVGFEQDSCEATVLEVHPQDDALFVVTDQTPFYSEMGGQAGDTGTLTLKGEAVPVTGVQPIGQARAHIVNASAAIKAGDQVTLRIDAVRRRPIEAHHTATHLLHWALHEAVSQDATQQGSSVDESRLRFDFNSAALTHEHITKMEEMVNGAIQQGMTVSWKEVPHASIKDRKDIMQFFGDKYGELVRVVQIGGEAQQLNGPSMELCGGTHVRNTKDVGFFKIKSEGAIASGVRRIEAVCGEAAWNHLRDMVETWDQNLTAAQAKLKVANAELAALGEAPIEVNDFPHIMGAMLVERADISEINATYAHGQRTLEETLQAAVEAEKRIKKLQASQAAALADEALAELIAKGEPIVASFESNASLVQELQNGLKKKGFAGPALLVVDDGSKLHLAVHCGADALAAGLKAGDLLRELAAIAGGKGGGKPDQARGAAPDRDKLAAIKDAAAAKF